MVGFTVYARMPEDELRKAADGAILQINAWFIDNPDREDCTAEFWYGKMHTIKRDSVAEQIKELVEEAIKEDKAQGTSETRSTLDAQRSKNKEREKAD